MTTPATIEGYRFFNAQTEENIVIKGVAYYPRPNKGELDFNNLDFFTEEYRHVWERDIQQFKSLGVNAVRLYSVDPEKDHGAFMCALSSAGIYALVELATGGSACPKKCAITELKAPDCYPRELKRRGETIIKEFSKYNNTLVFSAGNEVNHFVPLGETPEWNAPCLKKFVRDMRAYIDKCHHMRHIPVGLIMADTDRDENALYYNCQSDPNDRLENAEWYGINTYVYCDGEHPDYKDAKGFQYLQQSFQSYNYSIPVLLTEFGCLSESFPTVDGYEGQRTFNQAKWLSMPSVQNDFAGGFAFEYSIEAQNAQTPFPFKEFGKQNYGVGYFAPEECDDVNIMCEYKQTPSFYNLKNAYAYVKPDINITLSSFVTEEGREGRTPCPANFPSLQSYAWKADYIRSISCPKRSNQLWQCPAGGTAEGSNTTVKSHHDISIFLTFLTLCAVAIVIIHIGKRRQGYHII